VLLAVVAGKTGYPVDLLRPEMALEADLGIDSVKRVEILAAEERLPGWPARTSALTVRTLATSRAHGGPAAARLVPEGAGLRPAAA
jgi:hypothetical protein